MAWSRLRALLLSLLLCRLAVVLGTQLVVLLSGSQSGQVTYEGRRAFVTKPQIAVISPHLGLHCPHGGALRRGAIESQSSFSGRALCVRPHTSLERHQGTT